VRPQTIEIAAGPADDGAWWVEGSVTERAYLGEYWEYVVRPTNADLKLRVTTPPTTIYEAGHAVWARIDPARIAAVPSPGDETTAPL
jgi:hypothetical protein